MAASLPAKVSKKQLKQVLSTVAPNIIFPYARETIDSSVTKATFYH